MVSKSSKKKSAFQKIRKTVNQEKVNVIKEQTMNKSFNKNIFIIVIVLFVIFFAGEIYYVTKKSIIENKKPEYVGAWKRITNGVTSIAIYSNYMYVVDNERGQIFKYEKNNGQVIKTFEFEDGAWGIVQSSDEKMYVLHKNNLLSILDKDGKQINKINFGQGTFYYIWIDIDSKDNIYLVDGTNAKINKYSTDFQKILEFGGRGIEREKFSLNLAKVIVGPKDELYCIENKDKNLINIKIFENNGKFKKQFSVKHLKQVANLENLAISPDGYIYINDFMGSKILVYNNNGRYMGAFDTDINKQFLITFPASICGDKNGLFYVATHKNGIFKFIKY